MRGELDEPIAVYLKGKLQPAKPDRLNKGAKLHEDGDGADLFLKKGTSRMQRVATLGMWRSPPIRPAFIQTRAHQTSHGIRNQPRYLENDIM